MAKRLQPLMRFRSLRKLQIKDEVLRVGDRFSQDGLPLELHGILEIPDEWSLYRLAVNVYRFYDSYGTWDLELWEVRSFYEDLKAGKICRVPSNQEER